MPLSRISEELETPATGRDPRPRRVKQVKIGQYTETRIVKKSAKGTKKNNTNNRNKKVIPVNGDENEDVDNNLVPVKATSKNNRLKKEKTPKIIFKVSTESNQRQQKTVKSKGENEDIAIVLKADRKITKKKPTKGKGASENGEENIKNDDLAPKIEIKKVKKMVPKECKSCFVNLKHSNALLEKDVTSKQEKEIEGQASVVETVVKSRGGMRVRRTLSEHKESGTICERRMSLRLRRDSICGDASSSAEIKRAIIKHGNSSRNERATFGRKYVAEDEDK